MVRASRWLACLLVMVAGCAAIEPESEADIEALRVCHTTVVEGIDVAEYQGAVDWNLVRASGREFGIARIADGEHLDSTFAANWRGMAAAGMVRGAYYFFRPSQSVPSQAQHVADAVGVLGDGDLPVTIDVECMCPYSTPGHTCTLGGAGCATAADAAAALMQMSDLVAASTGKRPMIYTSARVWDGASYYMSMAHEPSSALWVPGYITGCVAVPADWTDWQFWQYSDGNCSGCVTGAIPGVSTGPDCDRNRWNGTLAELRAFASGDGTIGADAGVIADAGHDAGTGSGTDAASADAGMADASTRDAAPGDATHVDIVLPGDGSIVSRPISGGCGCRVTGPATAPSSSPMLLGLTLSALVLRRSRRVFERRSRRTSEQDLA